MQLRARHVSLALAWTTTVSCADSYLNSEFELQQFKTEPSFRIPKPRILNITQDRSLLQPGYIFLDSTFSQVPLLHGGTGPMIVDTDGNLIWSGAGIVSEKAFRTQHTHVCDYKGEIGTHLCTTESIFEDLHETLDGIPQQSQFGIHRVFNQQYEQVSMDYAAASSGFSTPQHLDQHEFVLVNEGRSFIQLIYHPTEVDFSPLGGNPGQRLIQGCFQEIDVATNNLIFHWCGLDHFQLSEALFSNSEWVIHHNSTSEPWDWMHLNSVDKNEEGDYLLSIRYFNQIVKVAGPSAFETHGVQPGTIFWRLGGPSANVKSSAEIDFMFQHDARYISTGTSETFFTVFDNMKDPIQALCSAKLIKVNNETMQAELIREWRHPDGIGCDSMGSARVLPNGNMFIGWGNQALYSEFSASGELLYHASFTTPGATPLLTYNYRSLKASWVGKPTWAPKLVASSTRCGRSGSPPIVYVSWNGATEVATWRFSVSTKGSTGPWIDAGTVAKQGFETRAVLHTGSQYLSMLVDSSGHIKAEALDTNDNVLGYTLGTVTASLMDGSDTECHYDQEYGSESNSAGGYSTGASFYTAVLWIALAGALIISAIRFFRLAPMIVRLRSRSKSRRHSMAWEQDAPLLEKDFV